MIGGAAGAFPPMIGWAMATGELGWVSFALFLFVFMDTPHTVGRWRYTSAKTMQQAFQCCRSWLAKAETKRQIILYSVAMVAIIAWFTLVVPGGTSWVYGLVAVAFGIIFIAGAIRVARSAAGDYDAAKKLFGFSILYLAALFAVADMTDAETVVRFCFDR